jgi:hypothetical protein
MRMGEVALGPFPARPTVEDADLEDALRASPGQIPEDRRQP